MASRHLRIHGLVQGVGYRASLTREALRLGVGGWVRNRTDGSVEAVVDGADAAVADLLAWARRGPPAARVDRIEVSLGEGSYDTFTPLPTA